MPDTNDKKASTPLSGKLSGKVLACIDDSRYAESVCDYAAWGAQRMDAPLSLLHVLDKPDRVETHNLSGNIGIRAQEHLLKELADLDEKRARIGMEQGKHMLRAASEHVTAKGIQRVESRQRHGDLVETLAELQPEIRMLVMGKRGADTESAHGHIGSHLESVIRTLQKPILVAQQSFSPPERIMIAYDGSATARKGVQMIADSPLFRGIPANLVLVGADSDTNQKQLREGCAILEQAGFNVTPALINGDAETALSNYQQEAGIDLLVMGAYGHSRIRHMIVGSTTTAMLRKTRISLMVLR